MNTIQRLSQQYAVPRLVVNNPLLVGSSVLFAKGLICDSLAQLLEQPAVAVPLNWHRTLALALYGAVPEAIIAYHCYKTLFPQAEAYAKTRLGRLAIALALDNFVLWPLLIYPTYYPIYALCSRPREGPHPVPPVEVESGRALEPERRLEPAWRVAAASLRTYFTVDFAEVNLTSMAFWVPANSFTFMFVAHRWRSTCMGALAFVYGVGWSLQQQTLRESHRKEGRG
eukprot:EG_transcript_28126